mmetsp:Transcript_48103/g.121081  ORF Transcript_48103/g.121081 Transcript_48103/m.121081 type:complete len:239 (+) Transcript_48103:3507-4223(+)
MDIVVEMAPQDQQRVLDQEAEASRLSFQVGGENAQLTGCQRLSLVRCDPCGAGSVVLVVVEGPRGATTQLGGARRRGRCLLCQLVEKLGGQLAETGKLVAEAVVLGQHLHQTRQRGAQVQGEQSQRGSLAAGADGQRDVSLGVARFVVTGVCQRSRTHGGGEEHARRRRCETQTQAGLIVVHGELGVAHHAAVADQIAADVLHQQRGLMPEAIAETFVCWLLCARAAIAVAVSVCCGR